MCVTELSYASPLKWKKSNSVRAHSFGLGRVQV